MAESSGAAKRPRSYQQIILVVQMAMIAVMSTLILLQGKLPGWDMLGLILLTFFLWAMRDRIAFLDFAPFLLMLFTYETIRSVISAVGTEGVHVADIIAWERALCAGIIPASVFQKALNSTPVTWAVDLAANGFYMTHFFSVIAGAFILWWKRKEHYGPFVLGLVVLSYAAFLTYVFFPAAPPWWASLNGYLGGQPVNLTHSLLSPEYIIATANALGAMPSLHTAWPFFLLFYGLYVWGRKALPVAILPAGVALSSIYLGHHYLVDVLAGIVYAVAVFVLAIRWGKARQEAAKSVGSLVTA